MLLSLLQQACRTAASQCYCTQTRKSVHTWQRETIAGYMTLLQCSDCKAASITDSPDLEASVDAFRTPELHRTVTLANVA